VIVFSNTAVASNPADGTGVVRRETGIRFNRLTLVLLDNHSAHISKETKAWLADQPAGRFEFTFTPKHGSWLNRERHGGTTYYFCG
jgi:DDE superfamily endonuclease